MNDRLYRMLALCDPGFLAGFRFADWCQLLTANQFDIEWRCWPRAMLATAGSMVTSTLRPFDERMPRTPFDEEAWEHPLFILGMGRSGSTHLFEVLSRDERFAFPTRLDVYHPHTFLTLRHLGADRLLGAVGKKRRQIDNMQTGWLTPEEDVFALQVLMGMGNGLRHIFPQRYPPDFEREATLCDRPEFVEALRQFTRKLVFLHGKPLLLKSPPHINWLPAILRVFPRARFVVIFRNPARHFASQKAVVSASGPSWSALQSRRPWSMDEQLAVVAHTLERYFVSTRALMPAGRFVEIRHEDLVADEACTLRRIHEALAASAPPHLVPSAPPDDAPPPHPYQPNQHPEPDEETLLKIRHAYRRLYTGGYYA